MTTIRMDAVLVAAAEKERVIARRSLSKQLEYWASLGQVCARFLTQEQVRGVLAEELEIHVRPAKLSSTQVVAALEHLRETGDLERLISCAPARVGVSEDNEEVLVRVDMESGETRRIDSRGEGGEEDLDPKRQLSNQ